MKATIRNNRKKVDVGTQTAKSADLTALQKVFASGEKPLEFNKSAETLKDNIVSTKNLEADR